MTNLTLDKFTVTGYKGFSDGAEVCLSPITLVYGENSAGKSSLIRLLVSMAEAIYTRSNHPLIPVSGHSVGGSFRELLGATSSLKIKLEFIGEQGKELNIAYSITFFPEWNRAVIVDFQVDHSTGEPCRFTMIDESAHATSYAYSLACGERKIERQAIRFEGLKPILQNKLPDGHSDIEESISEVASALADFSKNLIWIGPLRHTPARDIRLEQLPDRFDPDGKNLSQLLHPANPRAKELVEKVSEWYESATKHTLSVSESISGGREIFSILLTPLDNPNSPVPISDHGAGMAQVLPVVILCCAAQIEDRPVWLLLENPELHLHDGVHESLAKLFSNAASKSPHSRIVVETHSENVLLAIQLESIENKIIADKVVVNWVQKESGGSISRSFKFDANGSLGGLWSKSIFGYTGQLARKIIEAKSALRKKATDAN